MAKFQLKVKCVRQDNTNNGSNASFVVEKKDAQPIPGAPGQPPRIPVRNAVRLDCEGMEAKQFEPGKTYTITIE